MNSWCKNLELLIKSRTSLIWIKTKEEERLEKLVNFSCERINIKRLVCWDCVNGIKGLINEEGKFSNNPLGVLNWLKEQSSEVSTILLVKNEPLATASSNISEKRLPFEPNNKK